METQNTLSSQSNIKKIKRNWRNQPPWHHSTLQATVIKIIWYQYKTRNIDQLNSTESPEINPSSYGQLIYDKEGKNTQWGKESVFNKWCRGNWAAVCKRMKLEHFMTPYTKINSKCIKDLNVSPDTIKLLEENIDRMLFDVNHSNIFDPPPTIMTIKIRINKWADVN